jgi:hypothetical protein
VHSKPRVTNAPQRATTKVTGGQPHNLARGAVAMGAGASLYSLTDVYNFDVALPAFQLPDQTWEKLGNPESLSMDEWKAADEERQVTVEDVQLQRLFAWADRDGDGKINKADFVWFCGRAVGAIERPRVNLDDVRKNGLGAYLGPVEASHGFRKALSAVAQCPECAAVPRAGSEGWLALHSLLCLQDPAHAKGSEQKEKARAARAAAVALVHALCRAYPAGASKRVMAGTTYVWPWGHTALDLAVMHNWGPDVVQAVIAAWPAGATTFDPKDAKVAKKMKKPNHKKCRYPRDTAEQLEKPDPTVLALLPIPSKKKGKYVWHLEDGTEVDPATMKPLLDAKGTKAGRPGSARP